MGSKYWFIAAYITTCMACDKTSSTNASAYIPIINKLSNQGDWKEAIEIAKVTLSSTDPISEKDKINFYLLLGQNYRYLEKYQEAEKNFQKVVSYSKLDRSSDFLGEAYYGLGDLSYLKWSYFKHEEILSSAKDYLDSSMVYATMNNQLKLQSKILYRQGTIFQIQGNENESSKRFERGLEISASISDTVGLIRNNTHIAAGLKSAALWDSALFHYGRAYHYAKAINRNYSIAHSLCNLGLFYLDKEEIELAKDHFNQALSISENLNHRIVLCRSYYGLALVEEKFGNQAKAINYGQHGLSLATEVGYINFEQAFTNLIEGLKQN